MERKRFPRCRYFRTSSFSDQSERLLLSSTPAVLISNENSRPVFRLESRTAILITKNTSAQLVIILKSIGNLLTCRRRLSEVPKLSDALEGVGSWRTRA